jgi:universal stress protein E
MRSFKKILVWTGNDSTRQASLGRAARLAKHDGATITLTNIVEDTPWYARILLPSAEELRALLIKDKSEYLEKLAVRLRQDGIPVLTKILQGRAYLETIREVLRSGHDLVLKESEPNGNVRFGPADMHLLRNCPCPVWLVRHDEGAKPIQSILAAVDPAPDSDEMEELHLNMERTPAEKALNDQIMYLATSLAAAEGADLHVLHAWSVRGEELLRRDAMLSKNQVESYVQGVCAAARTALDSLLARFPEQTDRRFTHLLKGPAAEVIAEFTKQTPVDLIIMGTVARTGIPGLLIGNTAEALIQRVDCSILTIKPTGFVSPVSLND